MLVEGTKTITFYLYNDFLYDLIRHFSLSEADEVKLLLAFRASPGDAHEDGEQGHPLPLEQGQKSQNLLLRDLLGNVFQLFVQVLRGLLLVGPDDLANDLAGFLHLALGQQETRGFWCQPRLGIVD